VERGPDAPVEFRRIDTDSLRVKARLQPGQRLLVQETYDPSWRGYENGRAVPIAKDAMGFLLLDPGPGDHDLLLRFETPLENRVGALLTLLAFLVIAWLAMRRRVSPS
jgi:uncharacterized membrane protein YfhO